MKTSTNYTSGFITTAIVICSALVIFLTVGTVGDVIPSVDMESITSIFSGDEEETENTAVFQKVEHHTSLSTPQGAEAQGAKE